MQKALGCLAAGLVMAACSATDTVPTRPAIPDEALKVTQRGATLQASKTIDVCNNGDGTYTYSGEVSVWNLGAIDADGLHIYDAIQTKNGSGKFYDVYTALDSDEPGIPAYTPEEFAYVFPYTVTAAALTGDIRNSALVTIINHAGGQTSGPNPKATWVGAIPDCSENHSSGCTLTQGYWKTHNNDVCLSDPGSPLCVTWPGTYTPDATFFLSGDTWLGVFNTQPHGNQYYVLAHQYEAALLNIARGASVPSGVADIINQSTTFFTNTAPSACGTPGSCSLQATWAGILDSYNNGQYPGGPPHCDDVEILPLPPI